MDCRCPVCGTNQTKGRFGQSMVARMAKQCHRCHSVIHLNVHRLETIVVLLNFAAIAVLAVFAWWFHSRGLALVAVGVAIIGTSALPLLERTYLRNWPRYVAKAAPQQP